MKNKTTKSIILGLLALSAVISFFQATQRIIKQQTHPSAFLLHSLSAQFEPLQPVFAHLPRAGYYTDKNIEHPLAVAQYEQAQYMLAPTVLELNKTDFPLVIFDCTTPAVALAKIKDLGLVPVSASKSGIILALNPHYGGPRQGAAP